MRTEKSSPALLSAVSVSKGLDGRAIIRDLTLSLASGESVGLLGLNGAGKTTTLKLLATLLFPDTGQVLFRGVDVRGALSVYRNAIGYLADDARLYSECTVYEHLKFLCRLRGIRARQAELAVARVVELCELGTVRKVLCSALSRGYRQRVGLASCLLHEPEIVFLDEPTGALDPKQREHFRLLLSRLKESSVAVLHSSHLLHEVGLSCQRVIIVDEGRAVAEVECSGDIGALERVFFESVSKHETIRPSGEMAA